MLEVDDAETVGRRTDHDGARAIAEQHAGRAIGVVDDARHDVGAHRQRVAMRPGRHHMRRRRQRVGEARAGRAQIEAPRRSAPILSCSRHAVLGNIMSGVVVPTTMKSMSCGVRPACAIALERRLLRQIRRGHAGIHHVALADAGALENPLVAGIDQLFEILVREQTRRNVGREPADLRSSKSPLCSPQTPSGCSHSEVVVGQRRCHAPPGRAIEKSYLNQERLVDIFDGVFFFADRRGDAVDADRPAAELVDDRPQQLPIDLVESMLVDLEQLQRVGRHRLR